MSRGRRWERRGRELTFDRQHTAPIARCLQLGEKATTDLKRVPVGVQLDAPGVSLFNLTLSALSPFSPVNGFILVCHDSLHPHIHSSYYPILSDPRVAANSVNAQRGSTLLARAASCPVARTTMLKHVYLRPSLSDEDYPPQSSQASRPLTCLPSPAKRTRHARSSALLSRCAATVW